jgi:hypothetical protein
VLGVLIEIFRCDAVAAPLGFPRESDITLKYLGGIAADLNVGAVAVKGLVSLWRSLLLLDWPVAGIAAGGTLT